MNKSKYTKERHKGRHIQFEERQLIEFYVRNEYPNKIPVSLLARKIGCSESTIRRELKRPTIKSQALN